MPDKYLEGDVLYLDDGYGYHYHIILISSKSPSETRHLCVFLSSSKLNQDSMTTFQKGEDSFITKNCWVKYQSTYIKTDTELGGMKDLMYVGKASASTIQKIKHDLPKARRAPKWLRELYQDWEDDKLFRKM